MKEEVAFQVVEIRAAHIRGIERVMSMLNAQHRLAMLSQVQQTIPVMNRIPAVHPGQMSMLMSMKPLM